MFADFWQSFMHFIATWGSNPLVDILFGSLLTLLAVFFRRVVHGLAYAFTWFRAIVRRRGKDYRFERAYLNWMINKYRYLGLLPARTVASRWGEQRSVVNLEEVYVTLQVSGSGSERRDTGAYRDDASSWRRPPWWHWPLLRAPFPLAFSLLFVLCALPAGFLLVLLHLQLALQILIGASGIGVLLCFWLFWSRRRLLLKERTYQLGDVAQAIDLHARLVIRGDPGSGKTTLLRYLALTCARTLRNTRKQGDRPEYVRNRLLWRTCPFPVLVTLRFHHDVVQWNEQNHFIDLLAHEFPAELRKQCPEGFFARKLARGNCLLLLDAFDELGSPEARATMARNIGEFLSMHEHRHNRVVMTTRVIGYEGQLNAYDFQVRTVQPLHAGEVRALIKQRYRAVALSETSGWSEVDATPVLQDMHRRSDRLIKKIEGAPRLAQLATNPLLLSLIVLVHRVKVELPEERILLYRDCVEILAEQWQRSKRVDDRESAAHEDLRLSQKLVLLQTIALYMQQQREVADRQTLIPQAKAQALVASTLPDILGGHLPTALKERQEVCAHKAEAWIRGIQIESGILVEQGLDEDGNPLIGFSHLTFQEYLAAQALNEQAERHPLLLQNLLAPTWREVVLLYVALTSDATPVIVRLLTSPEQPAGVLLAGLCLAEKVRHVRQEVQQQVLEALENSLVQLPETQISLCVQALAGIGGHEATLFLRKQLAHPTQLWYLEVIKALGQTRPGDVQYKEIQADLVQILETPQTPAVMIAVRQALAQLGDPRFTQKVPVMISVPLQTGSLTSSPKSWKELRTLPMWRASKKMRSRFAFISRVLDYQIFKRFHSRRRHLPERKPFALGKYPVTNVEYARFVTATGHQVPKQWIEGVFPIEKATHPVTGIASRDARAYCRWLSQATGEQYRLPTEWEWEWAAAGPQGWTYPWGDEFDEQKCNTKESLLGETTPVGSYLSGVSKSGATDMSGNILEITEGYTLIPTHQKELRRWERAREWPSRLLSRRSTVGERCNPHAFFSEDPS